MKEPAYTGKAPNTNGETSCYGNQCTRQFFVRLLSLPVQVVAKHPVDAVLCVESHQEPIQCLGNLNNLAAINNVKVVFWGVCNILVIHMLNKPL